MTIASAVASALEVVPRALLAVSGGIDSMVLLDAAASAGSRRRVIVATFDHRTGAAASAAAAMVAARCALLGIECIVGRASEVADGRAESEARLRQARWRFLREAAARCDAPVWTAHTRDDQVETVLMRVLRGAGARGLAGLYAAGPVVRPLLAYTRGDVSRYAHARSIEWSEDPSNSSRQYLRNRVRHDLLPALRNVRPDIDAELVDVARRAAAWRAEVAAYVDSRIGVRRAGAGLDVLARALAGQESEALCVLWPALAARAGLVLDRRGTVRLADFSANGRVGSRIQLSGGWEAVRSRDAIELRPPGPPADRSSATVSPTSGMETMGWGRWTFRPARTAESDAAGRDHRDAWVAWLPTSRRLSVRAWRPGDVMAAGPNGARRKVKGLLSAAGVTGSAREAWPVVLAGTEIVWIPGVRRSNRLDARGGEPGLAFLCEREQPQPFGKSDHATS